MTDRFRTTTTPVFDQGEQEVKAPDSGWALHTMSVVPNPISGGLGRPVAYVIAVWFKVAP